MKAILAAAAGAVALAFAAFTAVALGVFDAPRPARPEALAGLRPPTIAVAPSNEALTFARASTGATVAVVAYTEGEVDAVSLDLLLDKGEDAIDLVNRLGYETVRAEIGAAPRIRLDVGDLGVPVDLGDRHVAVGVNYPAHADEASVEGGPFLFPKYVAPTAARAPIPAGEGLLDYEVELCLVAMTAIGPDDLVSGGLVLCNDVTDRARLLREIDPDEPESGRGFTSGKSAPGYLPVGDLFVVPRDLDSFLDGVELKLSVNGEERQRTPATRWIWNFERILAEARARQDAEWSYWGGSARLPLDERGALPPRTLVLAGTPGGTVFKGLYPSAYARGVVDWIARGFNGPVSRCVVERHIGSARAHGEYLKEGDLVAIEVDRLGALANRVSAAPESGSRLPSEGH